MREEEGRVLCICYTQNMMGRIGSAGPGFRVTDTDSYTVVEKTQTVPLIGGSQ